MFLRNKITLFFCILATFSGVSHAKRYRGRTSSESNEKASDTAVWDVKKSVQAKNKVKIKTYILGSTISLTSLVMTILMYRRYKRKPTQKEDDESSLLSDKNQDENKDEKEPTPPPAPNDKLKGGVQKKIENKPEKKTNDPPKKQKVDNKINNNKTKHNKPLVVNQSKVESLNKVESDSDISESEDIPEPKVLNNISEEVSKLALAGDTMGNLATIFWSNFIHTRRQQDIANKESSDYTDEVKLGAPFVMLFKKDSLTRNGIHTFAREFLDQKSSEDIGTVLESVIKHYEKTKAKDWVYIEYLIETASPFYRNYHDLYDYIYGMNINDDGKKKLYPIILGQITPILQKHNITTYEELLKYPKLDARDDNNVLEQVGKLTFWNYFAKKLPKENDEKFKENMGVFRKTISRTIISKKIKNDKEKKSYNPFVILAYLGANDDFMQKLIKLYNEAYKDNIEELEAPLKAMLVLSFDGIKGIGVKGYKNKLTNFLTWGLRIPYDIPRNSTTVLVEENQKRNVFIVLLQIGIENQNLVVAFAKDYQKQIKKDQETNKALPNNVPKTPKAAIDQVYNITSKNNDIKEKITNRYKNYQKWLTPYGSNQANTNVK